MEAVSGATSILQLLAAAIAVTDTTRALLRAICDAPRELQDVAIKVSIIQSQLHQLSTIKDSIGHSEDRTLSSEFRKTIELSLNKTRLANVSIQDAIRPLKGRSTLAARVHWAVLDRGKVVSLSKRLQEAEQSLSLTLQILEIQINLNLKASVLTIHQDIHQLATRICRIEEGIRNMELAPSQGFPNVDRKLDKRSTHYHFHLSLWGGRVECHCTPATTVNATCTFVLPLPYCGSRVLRIRLGVQHLSIPGWGFQLERPSLAIKQLVPDDSKVMKSCKAGDFTVIREMFQRGEANSNDVTSLGLTPLMCAIESGKLELVRFLIESGADVHAQLDQSNTNTLQLAAQYGHIDIFRRLLHENVAADHVDCRGWTAAFYLWPYQRVNEQSRTDFLKLLCEDGVFNIANPGFGEWTALHRAAMSGTADDVSTLAQYGADTGGRTSGLGWTPLHHATLAGNTGVIVELVRERYQTDINTRDARGWAPFHIAAYSGTYSTLCTLLEHGADPTLRSYPVGPHVAACVTTKSVTAEELAKLRGKEQHETFLQAMQSVNGILSEDAETFWDAVEQI